MVLNILKPVLPRVLSSLSLRVVPTVVVIRVSILPTCVILKLNFVLIGFLDASVGVDLLDFGHFRIQQVPEEECTSQVCELVYYGPRPEV